MLKANEISDILEMQLKEVDTKMAFEEVGTVMEVGDGVAHVFGLDNVQANELLEFENGVRGVAMNLEEDNVGVILMNAGDRVKENYTVKRTGSIASIKGRDCSDGWSTHWESLSMAPDLLKENCSSCRWNVRLRE